MSLQNMIFLYLIVKKYIFWTKPVSKTLTTSLDSLYYQDFSINSDNTSISTIDIVVGGDHGQGKFRSNSKFTLRDIHIKKLKSYVIKNAHIDCDKDTYDVLNNSIVKPLNEEIKLLINKFMFVFFMWNEDKKLIIKYSKEVDINKPRYKKIIQIKARLLISRDLAFFATIVGKVNMSGCWCHWCNLSPIFLKNAHIDCETDTYDVLNNSIVKPLNEEMKLLIKKICLCTLCGMKIRSLSSNIRKKKIPTNQFTKTLFKLKHVF